MRVMICGAAGMLGHDLVATAPVTTTLFPFGKAELDITDLRSLAATIKDTRPDIIVNAAAYTNVDKAESEPQLALRVNGEAVGMISQIACRAGVRVVHFSTDYVFDGTAVEPYREASPTNPVNTYGSSKLAGERALAQSGASFLLIRSQWLFGAVGRSFPRKMWDRARARLSTRVVADQTGRPTSTRTLACATWDLITREASGLIHVANAGEATWFDVASYVFASLGRTGLLSACATDDYRTPARRPRYSVLDTRRAERSLGVPLGPWQLGMDELLQHFLDLGDRA